jgi:hypothetical protein
MTLWQFFIICPRYTHAWYTHHMTLDSPLIASVLIECSGITTWVFPHVGPLLLVWYSCLCYCNTFIIYSLFPTWTALLCFSIVLECLFWHLKVPLTELERWSQFSMVSYFSFICLLQSEIGHSQNWNNTATNTATWILIHTVLGWHQCLN